MSTINPQPRRRGFNLPEMFLDPGDLRWADMIRGPRGRFSERDFAWIAEWGFNFVRLPLSYRWWSGPDDPQRIDEQALAPVDAAVEWAARHGLRLALSLHHAPGYCINPPPQPDRLELWGDPAARHCFAQHWSMLARRYRGVAAERLEFNLLNEPAHCKVEEHAAVVRTAIAAIRAVSPSRVIVLDGRDAGNTPCPELADVPQTVQSCRGYWPHAVTHHLAWWAGESRQRPDWPMRLDDGSVADRESLRARFAPWRSLAAQGVEVYCGELGAWHRTAHAVVLRWLQDQLEILRELEFGWALWNFRGSFGVLDSTRADVAYEDFHGVPLDRVLLRLLQRF
jgi:endoglucanase